MTSQVIPETSLSQSKSLSLVKTRSGHYSKPSPHQGTKATVLRGTTAASIPAPPLYMKSKSVQLPPSASAATTNSTTTTTKSTTTSGPFVSARKQQLNGSLYNSSSKEMAGGCGTYSPHRRKSSVSRGCVLNGPIFLSGNEAERQPQHHLLAAAAAAVLPSSSHSTRTSPVPDLTSVSERGGGPSHWSPSVVTTTDPKKNDDYSFNDDSDEIVFAVNKASESMHARGGGGSINPVIGRHGRVKLSRFALFQKGLYKWRWAVCITIVFIMVSLTSFYVGERTGRILEAQKEQMDMSRDELLLNQERLLLELVKNKHRNDQPMQDGDMNENQELIHHIELLGKELDEKTATLKEEKKNVEDATTNVQEAWGSYELFTAELRGVQRQREKDSAKLAHTMLVQRFGQRSAFYVQFAVSLHQESDELSYFTVRMAPVFLMPCSVFIFLEQVSRSMWGGTAITPESARGPFASNQKKNLRPAHQQQRRIYIEPEDRHRKAMEEMGFNHVAYGEYSKKYLQHTKYTLGFAGDKNPGPSFFINLRDNSNLKHEPVTESSGGEPCFAEVVLGFQTLDSMVELLTGDDEDGKTEVTIVTATLLDKWTDAVGSASVPEPRHDVFGAITE